LAGILGVPPSKILRCPKTVDNNKEAPYGYFGCPKTVDNNKERTDL